MITVAVAEDEAAVTRKLTNMAQDAVFANANGASSFLVIK